MKTKDITLCGIFTGFIIILSQVAIPLPSGIPFTLQTFAVCIIAIILGSKKAFVVCTIYILIGLAGFPVFSNLTGGIQVLFGKTGGFIISFPIMAYIIGFFSERTNNIFIILTGLIIGTVINFMFGMIIFSLVTSSSLYNSFFIIVVPFILSSIIKIILSLIIGLNIKERLN